MSSLSRPIIIAGNSGSGKDTIGQRISGINPDFVLSEARITTRPPRGGETGIQHIDHITFRNRQQAGRIIGAYEGIGGHLYGIDIMKLTSELSKGKHPILPFGGDTGEIQSKYLMDLAWLCRHNGYPIPLYFLLLRGNSSQQERDIRERVLSLIETQARLKRVNNKNSDILVTPILRWYAGTVKIHNLEGRQDETAREILSLFRNLNTNLGGNFFRQRHERP